MSRRPLALAHAALLLLAGATAAQEPVGEPPRLRARLPGIELLRLEVPAALRPGGRLGPPSTPARVAAAWREEVEAHVAERAVRRRHALLMAQLGMGPGEPEAATRRPVVIPRPEDIAAAEPPRTFRAVAAYADLGLDLRARMELKLDRLRNERCTVFDIADPISGCQGGFPTPSFDEEFRVRAGGVVSSRVHVDVDFDSEREFNANNNIAVFYQGFEDEILRRVEIGNVTFRAPSSRLITGAVPANSFGVQTESQVGPMEFRTIVAQQKGSALRTREFTVGEVTTQPVDFEVKDLDYESGRFFFVVDPRRFAGYPAVDVLNLAGGGLLPGEQPAAVRVYRLRAQGGQVGGNVNLGGIDAVAVRSDSPQRVGPFSWELLVEGRDYYLDPSGTWFALARRADVEDFLAVSYVTQAGDSVGTFPAVNGLVDTLELIHEPQRGPDVPTYFHEMRHWYRVGGQDVDRSQLALTLRVGTSEAPLDGDGTYLSRLGLALATDPTTLDEFNRVFPRGRDPGGGVPIRDLYVVFPNLMPFADSARLAKAERNDSLYRTPTYLLRSQGPPPRFGLEFHYEATGSGNRSMLSLGAIQIRSGSERIFLSNRRLVRGQDYEMDYALGQVTFLDPDALFAGPTRVRAEFEENQLFEDAPRTILGLSSTYDFGRVGTFNAIGIFQRERTVSTRPTLGFEPEAAFIGGFSTDLEFRGEGLTRLLDALPLVRTGVPSLLTVNGEVAVSLPNSNRAGAAYLEDFDRESAFTISLAERSFQLGSAPSSGVGLPLTHLGSAGGFAFGDAVPMVWQNLVQGSSGNPLQFEPRDIDTTIVLAGSGVSVETVLWVSVKPDTVGGLPDPFTGYARWARPHTPGPRWRSMTQPLGGGSGVGADLSRVEFLEFWLLEDALLTARDQGAYLLFDFGSVFEDAVDFAPESLTVVGGDTTFAGFQFAGLGRLDTEKDTLTNVFNARLHDLGIRGDRPDAVVDGATGEVLEQAALCDLRGVGGLVAFPLGDLLAACTRGNGYLDTEDIDGDNRLDLSVGKLEEHFVRYVFPVGNERFFVRNGASLTDGLGRTLQWRLYRIPFRADTVTVGRPNPRQMQALRLTVVAPDRGADEREFWLAFARMRLLGAPWLKRAPTPIAGLGGDRGEPHGEVVASIVTTESTDLGYEPPPGVLNQPERLDIGLGLGTVQINEKSLRLLARDLRGGERAEAFIRFTDEADKNFLKYRTLRLWARGRGAGWAEGDLEFYVKVGRDEDNFYLYRTPVRTDTWLPEIAVELDRWLALRGQIESAWLRGDPPSGGAGCGGDTTAYVACDGEYLVQVRDPGTAPPNLARVSEVAVGMFRRAEAAFIDQAELWVDDIRLTDVLDDAGVAGALDLRLAAADVVQLDVSLMQRNPMFRQIGEDPTYTGDAATRVGTTVRADKLLPESWGLSIPVSVRYVRTSADPFYVSRTDVRADRLADLRRPAGSGFSYDVAFRRARRGESFLARNLLDPLSLAAARETATNVASLASSETANSRFQVQYTNLADARSVRAMPAFVVRLVNALPRWLRESELGRAIRTARLRWNPYQIRFSSALADNETVRTTFRVPVSLASDTLLRPTRGILHTWRNDAGIDFRPFNSLAFGVTVSSTRDLQDYGDSTTVGRLLELERRELLGTDVGFERARSLTTSFNVSPAFTSWLRPRVVLGSSFNLSRDPNRQDPVRLGDDSTGAFRLPETLSNNRRREIGGTFDIARLARGLAGDSSFVTAVLGYVQPTDVSRVVEQGSGFDRSTFDPDVGFQLALGGIDGFLEREGIPATSARRQTTTTVGGGVRFPLGLQTRLSYRETRLTSWQRRGDARARIEQVNREWPAVTVTAGITPPGAIRRLLTIVSAQAQYRVQETSNELPVTQAGDAGSQTVRTENNSSLLSPSLTLGWVGGLTTAFQYTAGRSEVVTSGNVTQSDRNVWGGTASFAFRTPQAFRLPNRVTTTIGFNSSGLSVCLLRTGSDECLTVSDSRRHQLDLRLDTGFSQTLRGGLSLSYVLTDQRHASSRLSQITFTIFGDITMTAGQLR